MLQAWDLEACSLASNRPRGMDIHHRTCGRDLHSHLPSLSSTTCSNTLSALLSSRHFLSNLRCTPRRSSTTPKVALRCMALLFSNIRLWEPWAVPCLAGTAGTRQWVKTHTSLAPALTNSCNSRVLLLSSLACLAGHHLRPLNKEDGHLTRGSYCPA